jgi:hypothetical protein
VDPPAEEPPAVGGERLGQDDEVLQYPCQGWAVGLGTQEVGADHREAVDEVVLRERRQISPVDASERGVHAAVGEVSDVSVQGRVRRGVQTPVGRDNDGEDEPDGRGAEKQSRLVGRADGPGGRARDPPVGGTPGAAVPAGRPDVQQADSGGAVGERPSPAPDVGPSVTRTSSCSSCSSTGARRSGTVD